MLELKLKQNRTLAEMGDQVAQKTKLGWFLMSPGQEYDHNRTLLTQTSQTDYKELCRLDILGLANSCEHDQMTVNDEFKEQLVRDKEGWYETGLPWSGSHPVLHSNKQGRIRRLSSPNKKLEGSGLTNEYDQVIRDKKRTRNH